MAITDLLLSNMATSTTTGAINNSDDPVTFSVASGDGNLKFPAADGTKYCKVVVSNPDGTYEIMKCTSRTGDALTCTRAQEGTTKISFSSGAVVSARFTAGDLADIISRISWSAYAATLLDDSTAAAARATLEIPRQVGGRKLAPAESLVLSRPSASTVDVDADNVLLRDASGNPKLFASLNVTIDITASGAAGLDTGSEASGTWYHVWAIGKADGTLSAMLSTATAIGSLTFPTDYTYAGYVGAVYNDGSSNLLAFRQLGDEVAIENQEVLTDGSQTTATSVDLSAIVPTTAAIAKVEMAIRSASGTSTALSGSLFADSAGAIRCARVQTRGGNTTTTYSRFMAETLLATAQTLWYSVDSGVSARLSLVVTGWRF